MAENQRRAEQAAFRSQHVRDWRDSGLTRGAYCEKHGLSLKTFYHWAKSPKPLKKKSAVPKTGTNVPLIPVNVIAEVAPGSASSGIRIHVRDKFVVELAIGFDAGSLERLWKTWS
jgi:transposase